MIKEDKFLVEINKNNPDHIQSQIDGRKYDINFTIATIKTILFKVQEMKLNPRDLQFTLQTSLPSLLAFLEIERDRMKYKSG
jgi:hypothetical protein